MWQLVLVGSSVLGIIRDSITKRITQTVNPLVALFYFYITAVGAAVLVSFLYYDSNPFGSGLEFWYARLFGIAFGIGVYGFFSAIKISLTKTQAFSNYRSLLSIGLAAVFLGEFSNISALTIVALVIFIVSLLLPNLKSKQNSTATESNSQWIFWMVLNIVFIGSGLFFVKLFTKTLLPIDLLVNQYIGSFAVVSLLLILRKYLPKLLGEPLSLYVSNKKTLILILFNGVITAFSLFLLYVAIDQSNVTVVTQIDYFIRTLAIAPIGLLLFKESKQFTILDYISVGLALIGSILLFVA